MGAKKKSGITTINLGNEKDLSRIISDKLKKKVGNKGFSKVIRELLISNFSTKEDFKTTQIQQLKTERKFLMLEIKRIQRRILDNADKLTELGYELKDLE